MPLPDLSALFNLPPERASAYLRAKGLKLTGPYWELDGPGHSRVFTVANLGKLDVLADIKAAVQQAIDAGKTERWFRAELIDLLQRKGWWGPTVAVDPITQEARIVQQGSLRRLQTIYRTNLQAAYMAGRNAQAMEQIARAPFAQYLAIRDSRTRPAHRDLHGKVFRLDAPEWSVISPPRGYNCRCRARYLSQRELDARELKVQDDVHILERTPERIPVDPLTGESPERVIQRGISLPDPEIPGGRIASWTDLGWDHLPGSDGAERALVDRLMEKAKDLGDGVLEALIARMAQGLSAERAILAGKTDAYAAAVAGGAHRGLLDAYRDRPRAMIERAIASLRRQIAAHEAKIENPDAYLGADIDPRQRTHLVTRKWPTEIIVFSAEIEVLTGLLKEKPGG